MRRKVGMKDMWLLAGEHKFLGGSRLISLQSGRKGAQLISTRFTLTFPFPFSTASCLVHTPLGLARKRFPPAWFGANPRKGSGATHLFPNSLRRGHRPAEGARPPPTGGGVIGKRNRYSPTHTQAHSHRARPRGQRGPLCRDLNWHHRCYFLGGETEVRVDFPKTT